MAAAAEVIAEKGYEAATMAGIAERAGALVGSLYHFFPSKESLADALLQRYGELVETAFGRIEQRVAEMSIGDLADAFLDLLVELHAETRAAVALLDARSDWSEKRSEFHRSALRKIARILLRRGSHLRPKAAEDVAVIVLHNMKAMKALTVEPETARPRAAAELREMNRLYLEHKLAEPRS